MNIYLTDLKMAAIVFPFLALLITIPFVLFNYHKYGSIHLYKAVLLYSFVLYLLCAYFLIILPLPNREEVAKMTSPVIQLIPFSCIMDIIKNFQPSLSFLKSSYVFVPLFNILLMIPFGIYLRYYFQCSFKKTLLYTMLLSLFFELTQLSGLYGIYPRPYRLCDIDDLIQNTLGGVFGYLLCGLLIKILPNMDTVNIKALEKGMKVSGFKRFTSLVLDMLLCLTVSGFAYLLFQDNNYVLFIAGGLYFLIPFIINQGQTVAQKWLNLKVVDLNKQFNFLRSIYRFILFILIYMVIPFTIIQFIYPNLNDSDMVISILSFILCILAFILYLYKGIKFVFTHKTMLYETVSKTMLISTIEVPSKGYNMK